MDLDKSILAQTETAIRSRASHEHQLRFLVLSIWSKSPVKLFENGVKNAEGVNEAVGKAKHIAAMSLYNILSLDCLWNLKLHT